VRVAFAHRPERTMIEDEMAAARAPLGSKHKSWLPDLQLGYSKLSESAGLRTGDTLLGGNIVHPAGTFTIPLRDTGERSAEHEAVMARLRRLDTEMAMIEQEISTELANTRIKAEADAERLGIARQRLELAEKARALVTARFENGLTGPDAVFAAEQFESLARLQAIEAGYASAASRQSIVMLCGLSQMPPSERHVVFTANARPDAKPGANPVGGIAHGGY
jgi:outer membrane protein TolC